MSDNTEYNSIKDAVEDSFPFKKTIDSLVTYVNDRLGTYVQITKKVYVERNYTDVNWRDLFSHHYSKSYYKDCSKFTIRVHLFENSICESDYLGYFVLRPIPAPYALSKIVLKPRKDFYSDGQVYLMANKEEVNIHGLGLNIKFDSFCALVQDTVANVCADACMNMAAKYLSKKFPGEFPNYRPAKLFPTTLNRRPIPSYGLSIYEMSQVMLNAGFRSYIEDFDNQDKFISFINSQIESALPVIVAHDMHVSLVVGHTLEKNGVKKYIVFDDSGSHLAYYGQSGAPLFSGIIDFDKFDWDKKVPVISFDFDKVYLRSSVVETMIQNSTLPGDVSFVSNRKVLVDYSFLMEWLDKHKHKVYVLQERVPHYVWWVESDTGGIIIDAASHKYDYSYSTLGLVEFTCEEGSVGSNMGLLYEVQ